MIVGNGPIALPADPRSSGFRSPGGREQNAQADHPEELLWGQAVQPGSPPARRGRAGRVDSRLTEQCAQGNQHGEAGRYPARRRAQPLLVTLCLTDMTTMLSLEMSRGSSQPWRLRVSSDRRRPQEGDACHPARTPITSRGSLSPPRLLPGPTRMFSRITRRPSRSASRPLMNRRTFEVNRPGRPGFVRRLSMR